MSGELFKRADGKYGFRVHASNGQVVATDGGQGYSAKSDARHTLEQLLNGDYAGDITDTTST